MPCCLGAARDLDRRGFVGQPSWEALEAGAGPPVPEVTEPGGWLRGWQHHSSPSTSTGVSHSGPGASSFVHGTLTQLDLEFQVQPVLFRTLLLEGMRLPHETTAARSRALPMAGI